MEEVCDNCRFYWIDEVGVGLCRRRSPIAVANRGAWPVVRGEDWCGEWVADEPVVSQRGGDEPA